MNVSAPSKPAHSLSARTECGEGPHCRSASDCPPSRSCEMKAGFVFGTCKSHDR
jgi:hypothetical protein